MDQTTCSYPPCERPARTKGFCSGHYAQQWKGQELRPLRRDRRTAGKPPETCAGPECRRWAFASSLCNAHYAQQAAGKSLTRIRVRDADGTPMPLVRDELGRKRCTGCTEWKSESEFYTARREPDGLMYRCKRCQSTLGRIAIARRHGLTAEQYAELSASQGDACAICLHPCPRGALSVDHDHDCCPTGDRSCGKCVRGLLCRACNIALGNMRDDPELLRRAAEYLEQRMT